MTALSQWRRRALLMGTLGLALSCAGGRSSSKIDERWLARVPEGQMGGVKEARTAEMQAKDEILRAEVRQRDAERGLQTAKAEEDAARAMVKARKSAVDAANTTGQAQQIQAAQQALSAANASLAAAEAKVDWRKEDVQARESERKLKERQSEEATARLRVAEFDALRASGDVRARDLSAADFHQSLANAERRAEEQQRETEKQVSEALNAHAMWQLAAAATPSIGGSGTGK